MAPFFCFSPTGGPPLVVGDPPPLAILSHRTAPGLKGAQLFFPSGVGLELAGNALPPRKKRLSADISGRFPAPSSSFAQFCPSAPATGLRGESEIVCSQVEEEKRLDVGSRVPSGPSPLPGSRAMFHGVFDRGPYAPRRLRGATPSGARGFTVLPVLTAISSSRSLPVARTSDFCLLIFPSTAPDNLSGA